MQPHPYIEKMSILIYLVCIAMLGVTAEKTFKAAVYEHSLIEGFAANRDEALSIMRQNLNVFSDQAAKARLAVSIVPLSHNYIKQFC